MPSHGYQPAQLPGPRHGPHGGYAPRAMPSHGGAPAGTFAPATKIQVGSHRVVIQEYLSEGGFAHVYLVKLSSPVDGKDLAVLKRVAVPDKEALRGMRTEVETMKRLKGHRPIVTYIDSHASELKNGGYEVFLLMEYCDGGGLIDFMNTRLQHRLTEPEILHIFADVAEGVACMHYLKPPLLHRDLKVENVLIVKRGSSKRFKVCDFGSTAPPRPAPTTVVECRLMDEDIQKHTTLQYRAPEMVDVYRKQPLNEKSDIWALGVFLYKLCYYTTPFEDQGQLAILNASFKYPSHPMFSDRLKRLIGSMLREDMQSRPNIYQVLKEACAMQGREVPIHDIYSGQAEGEAEGTTNPSSTKAQQSKPVVVVGAVYSPPPDEKPTLPEIVPMRRGRPAMSPGPQKQDSSARKVTDGDPFAALDLANVQKMADADEISSRFPTLDQFALLHDKGTEFDFDAPATSPKAQSMHATQGKSMPTARPHSMTPAASRVQHAPSPSIGPPYSAVPLPPTQTEHVQSGRASTMIRSDSEVKATCSSTGSRYVSTGTMTSNFSSQAPTPQADDARYGQTALPDRTMVKVSPDILPIHARAPHLRRPSLSSRPSLEDNHRHAEAGNPATSTSTSNTRQRPASTSFESSTLDFLRDKELAKPQKPSTQPVPQTSRVPEMTKKGPAQTDMSAQSSPREPVTDHASNALVDIDDDGMTAEMRREAERQRLEKEEKRVAAAQAEYRSRIASSGNRPTPGPKLVGGPPRTASTIQSRMQSLLSEDSRKPEAVQRTAQGYGRYTDGPTPTSSPDAAPVLPRKFNHHSSSTGPPNARPLSLSVAPSHPAPVSAAKAAGSKPPAPKKKPTHLNGLPTGGARAIPPFKQPENLAAMNLPGQPALEMTAQEKADYIEDFTKRYPSLTSLEMEALRGRGV
ncbi:hypothetical protein E4U41_003451 [Claviceps citrina]|nr:hypothetical protein E4U41_003451 [Claviceps citrina]